MIHRSSNIKNIRPLEPSCKKKAYHTREEALDMIKFIAENRVAREINAYQCTICGLWHLTSKIK
jgi:hypothetical protein